MKYFIVWAFIFLIAIPAAADPVTVKTYFVSPGTKYNVPGVGEVRYYLFDEYKLILRIDSDYYHALKKIKAQDDLILNYKELADANSDAAEGYKTEMETYKARSQRLEENWKKCEDKLAKSSGIDLTSLFIGTGVGVVLGGVLVTVLMLTLK